MPKITIVVQEKSGVPIEDALVQITPVGLKTPVSSGKTDSKGEYRSVELPTGDYDIAATAFGGIPATPPPTPVKVVRNTPKQILVIDLGIKLNFLDSDFKGTPTYILEGNYVGLDLATAAAVKDCIYEWKPNFGRILALVGQTDTESKVLWDTRGASGQQKVEVAITHSDGSRLIFSKEVNVVDRVMTPGKVQVSLQRASADPTLDQAFWSVIRNRTRAISFSGSGYADFIDQVLGQAAPRTVRDANYQNMLDNQRQAMGARILGLGAYDLLQTATQVFLLLEAGSAAADFSLTDRYTNESLFDDDDERSRTGGQITAATIQRILTRYLGDLQQLPYISRVVRSFLFRTPGTNPFARDTLIGSRMSSPPLIELIWSYWHEEGMLVQSVNAISLRFQNRRSGAGRDPLANLEIAPLYPLNNLLWGYVQDEQHRLTVARRNYEYNHQYGLSLIGKAVGDFQPADSRSRFLEAFHTLLLMATRFYRQADDTTVVPDAFPLLNAIKEVHMVLAEGAHNQFGDLPWTARVEMLMQQWLLARPEMREFLQSRAMVPYRQPWMAQVDTMKSLQGWTDVSVTHFHNLATYGEQLLLSLRYGDWMDVNIQAASAANWAIYWRSEIQGYIHAYRAATSVDLSQEARDGQQAALRVAQPSALIHQRGSQPATPALPPPAAAPASSFQARRAARQQ